MKQALSPETPVRVRRGQLRALTLGVGASALAMACSFGEIDGQNPIGQDIPAVTGEQPGPDGQGGPDTVVDPGPGPSTTPVTPTTPTTPAGSFDGDDPFQTVLGKEVKAILETNCGQCHQGTASGGMDYILNLQSLITNGKVIPGNKEDSQLFVRMQQQSMPPAFIRDQRPTYGQIDQVGLFIDEMDPNYGQAAADRKSTRLNSSH